MDGSRQPAPKLAGSPAEGLDTITTDWLRSRPKVVLRRRWPLIEDVEADDFAVVARGEQPVLCRDDAAMHIRRRVVIAAG